VPLLEKRPDWRCLSFASCTSSNNALYLNEAGKLNDLMSGISGHGGFMTIARTKKTSALLSTVLDPRGQPTITIQPHPLAPRHDTLQDKTVYLVDVGFGGGWEFLEETVGWFARNMPGVRTVLLHKKGIMFVDEPEMWEEMRQKADAVIFGVGG
jgi:hypothetical protein